MRSSTSSTTKGSRPRPSCRSTTTWKERVMRSRNLKYRPEERWTKLTIGMIDYKLFILAPHIRRGLDNVCGSIYNFIILLPCFRCLRCFRCPILQESMAPCRSEVLSFWRPLTLELRLGNFRHKTWDHHWSSTLRKRVFWCLREASSCFPISHGSRTCGEWT